MGRSRSPRLLRSRARPSNRRAFLFLSVTRIEEFAYALTRLGLPYKVGFTMTMAFRLVPVFVDAAATVVQAQRCRGLDFERGRLWQRMRRYVPVIVPVFMGALRRADQMAMALDARGFQARTHPHRSRTVPGRARARCAGGAGARAWSALVARPTYGYSCRGGVALAAVEQTAVATARRSRTARSTSWSMSDSRYCRYGESGSASSASRAVAGVLGGEARGRARSPPSGAGGRARR